MRKFYSFLILFFILSYAKAQSVYQAWATLAGDASPFGIVVDASGNVYTANSYNNTISKITPAGSVTQAWATLASDARPRAIAIDAHGNVYTSNTNNNTISKITPAGSVTQAWVTMAPNTLPGKIVIDTSGNLFIASSEKSTISKITPDGTLTQNWAILYPNAKPSDLAIDASGNIYAANTGSYNIYGYISKISPDGTVNSFWKQLHILTPNGMVVTVTPQAITIDPSGNLYTSNSDGSITKIAPDGTMNSNWVNLGYTSYSIAADSSGNVYTVNNSYNTNLNTFNNTISKISPDGTVTPTWATLANGSGPRQMVIVPSKSILYITNFSNNTVSKIYYCGPKITRNIVGIPICVGESVSFSVTATAEKGNLSYQWQKDGTDISGATSSTYNIPSAIASDSGIYAVNVSDYCGVNTSGAYLGVIGTTTANVVVTAPKRCGLNGSIELNTIASNTNIGSNNFDSNNLSTILSGPWSGNGGFVQNGKYFLAQPYTNQNGYLLFTPTTKPASFSAAFELNMYRVTTINSGAGNGDKVADGLSFNYGTITTPSGNYEDGILSGNGLVVRFKVYETQRIEVVYNGVVKGTYYADLHYPTGRKCMIAVSEDGKFSMRLGDSILVNNLNLGTAYATDSKSAWKFGWAARSGGSYENHGIDNIVVDNNNGFQYSIDNFITTKQPLPYFKVAPGSYTVKSKAAFCTNANTVGTATIPSYNVPNLTATAKFALNCSRYIEVSHDAIPYDTLVWSDFATRPTISNANNMGNASVNGSLSLTTNGNDQRGQIVFNPSRNSSIFYARFKVRIWDGNGADGFSFNYGAVDNMSGGQDGMFNTSTPGLSVCFLTYQGQKIRVKYKNTVIVSDRNLSDYNVSIRTGEYIPIEISVSPQYKLTVKIIKYSLTPNPVTLTIIDNYDLYTNTSYPSDNHSNWQFGFGGFTGGSNDNHDIEELLITGRAGYRYGFDNAYQADPSFYTSAATVVKVNLDGCEVTAGNFPAWGNYEIATTNTTLSSFLYMNETANIEECRTKMIAKVQSYDSTKTNAQIRGALEGKVWIENTQPTNFVKRHYQITPQANVIGDEAFVSLYFSQADFDAFNAVNTTKLPTDPSDAAGKANLRVEKRSGSSSDGTGLPASYTGSTITIDPVDNNITWDVAKSMWEVKFYVKGFSGFFVNTASAVLPIELLSFEASAQNGTNLLTWRTASEINNLGFDIERSRDGINFEAISRVKGKNKPSNYQYVDNVVYNTTYYRLKQLDYDGKTAYSNIVSAEQKGIKIGLKIYPTLVSNNTLNIDTEGVSSEYTIYNLMGQTVMKGKTGQSIDVSNLRLGTYIIKAGTETAKFVKQ